MRYWNGNLITTTERSPTGSGANGIFDLTSQRVYKGSLNWPAPIAVVTQGLLVHLDAGDPSSYPGTGSEWYDLSGNNYHMSLKNGPTFATSGGDSYFDLDGSNDVGICDGSISGSTSATPSNLGVDSNNPKTIVCVAMIDNNVGSTSGGLFDLGDSGSSGRHYCLRLNGNYTNFRAQFWGSSADYDFSYDGRGVWTMFSVVYENSVIHATYGNNGVLLGQDPTVPSLATSGSRPLEMGRYAGSNYFGGKIGMYLVYNRALSQTEVQANYAGLAGRFGF